MRLLIISLIALTSCTSNFRGTLIDVEELSFQPAWAAQGKKTTVKETVSED